MNVHASLTIGERKRLHVLLRQRIAVHIGAIMNEMDQEEFKRLTKEAIKEWLDSMFAAFGKWTLTGLLAMALAGLLAFIIWTQGLPGGR